MKNKPHTEDDLGFLKRKAAKKYKISTLSNAELLKAYHNLVRNKRLKVDKNLERILRKRKVRSLSGIVIVSVLAKPYKCPGKCLYCPDQKGVPKSYLNNEPAVMRAIVNRFDPYLQVKNRIKALEDNGHPTDKVDLRIIGGTWSYYPKTYQSWFITRCLEAANNSKGKNPQKINEKAKHRIIGITIETRPDYINKEEIKWMRKLGVTKVELGVQSIYDDVLKINRRGHLIDVTIKATKLLKDAGFKICYQMMPNLPGSNLDLDKKMFKELFSNPDFQPDFLKIYPCAILKEAPLYKEWKRMNYKPYTEKQLINVITAIKEDIPYYVRIQRIVRDIPSGSIINGPKQISNLRQIIQKDVHCKCIRCREIKGSYDPKEKIYLFRADYNASSGKEIFLSYENKQRTKLYSLLRLRISSNPIIKDASLIREVHTYGQMTPIGGQKTSAQHKGLGKKLIKEAENISKKEFKVKKIAVISGIGVRDYYRKIGYKLKDTYMVKKIA